MLKIERKQGRESCDNYADLKQGEAFVWADGSGGLKIKTDTGYIGAHNWEHFTDGCAIGTGGVVRIPAKDLRLVCDDG